MAEVVGLHPRPVGGSDDSLWAVIAWLGSQRRVAEVFPTRARAMDDREWRERQVQAYRAVLLGTVHPIPRYVVAPIRRSDLPRRWRPLPALGFLRGQWV